MLCAQIHPTDPLSLSGMMPCAKNNNREHQLYCASCGRSEEGGSNGVSAVNYLGHKWCARCANVTLVSDSKFCVEQPSPGRMVNGPVGDPLIAWEDCFQMKPKQRIKVKEARLEIQRAWVRWDGDKRTPQSMFLFYGWLSRFRPYFLTFRCKGDKWQRVHSWLLALTGASNRNCQGDSRQGVV